MKTSQPITGVRARPKTAAPSGGKALISDHRFGILAVTLVVSASLYNAMLAIISAHVKGLTSAAPIAMEGLLLGGAMGLALLKRRPDGEDAPAIALLYLFALLAVFTSLASDAVFPDAFRNVAIIASFFLLGRRCSFPQVHLAFALLTIITLTVLIFEIAFPTAYVSVFQPGNYYAATRGMEVSEFNETGLFNNAAGFESRFSFGVFSGARTSSVFLEQVSNANFAGILCVFLVATWGRLSVAIRTTMVATILLILLSNNTRTSSALAVVTMMGYFIFPHLSRWFTLLIAPVLVMLAFLVVGDNVEHTDDLIGRLGITTEALRKLDIPTIFGANAMKARHLMDTGFGYVTASSSIFGLIAIWLFFSLGQRATDTASKRCAWATAVYLFANMMIGGTAIFSMKVAAPLWMLVGYMAATAPKPQTSRPNGPAPRGTVVA